MRRQGACVVGSGRLVVTVGEHIQNADRAICHNIEALTSRRGLLSQNVLKTLRDLVEGTAVRLRTRSDDTEYVKQATDDGLQFIRKSGQYRFLSRFHQLLNANVAHVTLDEDSSERLMLKYYEYLLRLRSILKDECGISVLGNLESFPVDLDSSLVEYHEKIAEKIAAVRSAPLDGTHTHRYYIHKTLPFFVGGRVYYEVTFYPAINRVSKFDRLIAFTDIDIADNYSALLTLQSASIDVLGRTMPITVIREWEVSIRPCEFDNFARLLGITANVDTRSAEYSHLMEGLTAGRGSLLDLIDMPDDDYVATRKAGTSQVAKPRIFPILDEARCIIRSAAPGHNVLRYLMLRMNNRVIKSQYSPEPCGRLSGLKLLYGCIPFDEMPFCTSLPGHNPRYWDLVESLDATGREHELVARRVRNNVERHGVLYTPVGEVEKYGDVTKLVQQYNSRLYVKHEGRRLIQDGNFLFIQEYEDGTHDIIRRLQAHASSGVDGYTEAVERWLEEAPHDIDDPAKREALKRLFGASKVALIYGAAGTGKSTMINHIATYFNDKEKLFLAHTNPAVDNLKRKVTAQRSTFRTISSHISRNECKMYEVLVVDECSTVSNADILKVLKLTSFKLLVLVGDVYQIESIQFGNWFSIIRSFIPETSVFELTEPFRTKKKSLSTFWEKVRNMSDDIAEVIVRHGLSARLDKSLFDAHWQDEIILCLNYDGIYGINNVNRFLQSGNPSPEITWRGSVYKVGDPVLFNETDRFRPVIYNNMKGRIVDIQYATGWIRFDVELDRPLSESDVAGCELEWVGGSVVRFSVYDYGASDEDDDSVKTSVPFQVAYAVSIHKAQGLEYNSVKIVITDANEEDITHSIFYTAITRARESLKIYWTPETQQAVLSRLKRSTHDRDVGILSHRRGLVPLKQSQRPR